MQLQLTYQNKTYDLVLFDDYYITTKQPYAKKHSAALETIINAMQERSDHRFDYQYSVQFNGVEINPSEVHNILINN